MILIFLMFSRYVQIYLLYLFLHRSYRVGLLGNLCFFYDLTLPFGLTIWPYHLPSSKNFQCISKYSPMKWGYTTKTYYKNYDKLSFSKQMLLSPTFLRVNQSDNTFVVKSWNTNKNQLITMDMTTSPWIWRLPGP